MLATVVVWSAVTDTAVSRKIYVTVVSVTNDPVILYDDPFESVSVPDHQVTLSYPVDDQARLFTHHLIHPIIPLFTSETKEESPVIVFIPTCSFVSHREKASVKYGVNDSFSMRFISCSLSLFSRSIIVDLYHIRTMYTFL